MVAISRVKAVLSGAAVVGPAASSVFTTGQPANIRGPWIDFWEQVLGAFPTSLTVTIPNTGETYEDTTGALIDIWTDGTNDVQTGTSPEPKFASGCGGRVVWGTAGLTNQRRVRGATYLVPFSTAAYQADGTIDNVIQGAIRSAAEAFVAATQSDFVIWTRPIDGAGGKSSGVTGATFPDKVSTLRSRRV